MRDIVRAVAGAARLAWRADRRRAVLVLLCQLGSSVGLVGEAIWLKITLDGVAASDVDRAWTGAVLAGLGVLLIGACWHGAATQRLILLERAKVLLELRVLEAVGRADTIEIYERPDYHDTMSLLRQDIAVFVRQGWSVITLLTLSVEIAASAVALAFVHPLLLLLPVATVPALWTGRRASRLLEENRQCTAERSRLERHLFTLLVEPNTAGEIRAGRLERHIADRGREMWAEVEAERHGAHLRAAGLQLAGLGCFTLAVLSATLFTVLLVTRGAATVGDIVLVVTNAAGVRFQVGGLVRIVTDFFAVLHADRRFRWLDEVTERRPSPDCAAAPDRLTDGIVVDRVGFRYPGGDRDVLREISIRVPAGGTLAVVGPNGGGKSTLVKLLCGLYTPGRGHITVDGVELRRIDPVRWWSRISVAFQDVARLEFTALTSVGVGDLARVADDDAVTTALLRASALDVLDALPDGLRTRLGRQFGGVGLSGGQWQKLGVSRAMMRPQPLLLVLDEPASSFDPIAEHALLDSYLEASRRAARAVGAITLFVSHRLSTVRTADVIVVMDRGRVVESGDHESLIRANGVYADLYRRQAHAYADGDTEVVTRG